MIIFQGIILVNRSQLERFCGVAAKAYDGSDAGADKKAELQDVRAVYALICELRTGFAAAGI